MNTLRILRILTVSSLALAACKDKESPNQTMCDAYLDCLKVTDMSAFEDELEVYGPEGTCFEGDDDCQQTCSQLLSAQESEDAACERPPAEPVNPDEAVGLIECSSASEVGPTVLGGMESGLWEAWCNPRSGRDGAYKCCSDDPAAPMGELPAYVGGPSGTAVPYFSGNNNNLGTSGLCVNVDDIPAGSGLLEPAAQNCPVPCNPTWSEDDVESVCGNSRVCCQTRAMEPKDCILDGDTWRPVTGADVITQESMWATGQHATHQDPNGIGCNAYGGVEDDEFLDCVEQLSVANQRGFCMAISAGQSCPHEADDYLNTCDQINAGLIPPPGL